MNIEKIKGLWEKLLHQEATPNQIAAGFAIGLFVSFLPLPGAQTVLGLMLAYFLRTNKVACLAGLHLHLLVFPFIPLVFLVEYNLGKELLMLKQLKPMDAEHFNMLRILRKGWPIFHAMMVGSLVIGLPSAATGYWCVKRAAIRWQKARQQKTQMPQPVEMTEI